MNTPPVHRDAKIRVALVSLMASFALGACQPVDPMAAAGAGSDLPVTYRCADGQDMQLRFDTHANTALVTRGGVAMQLAATPADSEGYYYSNGATSIRGSETVVRLTNGVAAPVRCSST